MMPKRQFSEARIEACGTLGLLGTCPNSINRVSFIMDNDDGFTISSDWRVTELVTYLLTNFSVGLWTNSSSMNDGFQINQINLNPQHVERRLAVLCT